MTKKNNEKRVIKIVKDYNPNSDLFVEIKKDEKVIYDKMYKGNLGWENWAKCSYMGKTCYIPKQYLYISDNQYYLNRYYNSTELTVTKGMLFVIDFCLNGFAYGSLYETNIEGWVPLSSLEID
ncbi:hypothetical protein RJI07_04705 [Mycoplasmatota bacterium WC30]